MVEAPALISRPPVQAGKATAALILGIVGIIFPVIGIILGILAIIFGIIALRYKTTHVASAVVGIVTGAIAIIWSIAVILLVSFFAGHFSFPASDRDNAVTAQINEKKDFTIGETAKIGPVDVKITNVERNYVPTPEDVALASGNDPEEEAPSDSPYDQGTLLAEDDVEYVLVEGTERLNGSPFLGDSDLELSQMQLNHVAPYTYKGGLDKYQHASETPDTAVPMTYVFRIQKGSDSLKLTYNVSIWKAISPIVGTEGMPQQELIYTIALN